ncbi:hypothetical protein [Streptosporangium roseum]|uniref:Uncharacterized protein n=1 Tax=Streptosporangium roseum (strain ATCC 12428 / DSM 43021 / JCM 3005 / KCTC 9067 / NCIMB 10171 / NRRL 2505 / NI 9100) TaxID=479432 RepID=D2BCK1_STRRD|nr:hypothetical protein [Streptosporangium roseum]ACZ91821.1 hypothetical protein Sros_9202 [Streptosporangium roseum DSM 43021]
MIDIGSIVIPITVMLILAGAVTGCISFYFRFERHRTEVLAAELAKNRELAEQAVQQQEQVQARLAELTNRVAAVEQLLRSVE